MTYFRVSYLAVIALLVLGTASPVCAGRYTDAVLADNPVGYWRFEEQFEGQTGVTTVDSSNVSGNQNGTYFDGPTAIIGPIRSEDPNHPEFNQGNPTSNQAVSFNSNEGYVRIDDPGGLLGTPTSENPWTYEFWWLNQTPGPGGQNRPISKGSQPSTKTTNFNRKFPTSEWSILSGNRSVLFDDPIVGVWTHVVGIVHATNYNPNAFTTEMRVYVNGVLVGNERVFGSPEDEPDQLFAPLSFGAWITDGDPSADPPIPQGADNFFTGSIDEVAIYNYALDDPDENNVLSNTRIMAHYLAAESEIPPGPGTWVSSISGDWNNALNWVGDPPNSNDVAAIFDRFIAAPSTVFTEVEVTVESMTINNENEHVFMGNGGLTLDSDGSAAAMDVQQGNHRFQLPLTLGAPTTITTATDTSLTFKNQVDLGGNDLNHAGGGTIVFDSQVITGGGMLTLSSGALAGSGQIAGSVSNSGGAVAPGNSAGKLAIMGDYTQEDGSLDIEIAGLAPTTEHDVLEVGGVAILAGEVEIALLDGFSPTLGDAFDVLTAASIVDQGLTLGGDGEGFRLDVISTSTGEVLRVTAVPEPAVGVLVGFAVGGLWLSRKRLASVVMVVGVAGGLVALSTDQAVAQISTNGLMLHLDATDASTIEDQNGVNPTDEAFTGVVAAWRDKATADGANDATQGNVALAPIYLPFDAEDPDPTSPPTELPVVDFEFDRITWMDLAPVTFSAQGGGNEGMTAFLVVRADYDPTGGAGAFNNWEMWVSSTVDGDQFITTRISDNSNTTGGPWGGYAEPIVTFGNNGEARNAESSPAAVQAWHLITVGFDQNGSFARINGNPAGEHCQSQMGGLDLPDAHPCIVDPPTGENFTTDVTWDLLGDYGGIRGFSIADGEIGEIAMYDTSLDDVDRSIAESFLGEKWGISIAPPPTPGLWIATFSSTWHNSDNWSRDVGGTVGLVPGTDLDFAIFGERNGQPRSVFLETDVTIRSLTMDSPYEYAIGGNADLIIDTNTGTGEIITLQGSHEIQGVVTLAVPATVNTAAGTSITVATLNLDGNTLTKEGDGRLNVNDKQNTGGGAVVVNAGVVGGNGEFGGSLTVNSGATTAPGLSAGELFVETSYTQNAGATLEIEIGGLVAGEQYDVLNVTGAASLAGDLNIVLIDGFSPTNGDEFDVVVAGSISGNVNLTGDSAGFSASIIGDGGGDVTDGRDLLEIQRNNPADIANWQSQFGTSSGGGGGQVLRLTFSASAAAVPEPTTAMLCLVAEALWIVRRRWS